jgi:exoribonuclease-2
VMINGLVRADTLPLVFKAIGADSLPRNTRVRVRVTGVDELTLDVHASVIARIDDAAPVDQGDAEADDADESLDNAGPLTLAIDVTDAADANEASPPPASPEA